MDDEIEETVSEIDGSEADASENQAVSSSKVTVPKLVRMDTVLSEGGDHYDVLPLPSPGIEEVDSSAFATIGFKPRIPYMSIYSSPSRLLVGIGSAFLAKTKVTLEITEAKRDVTYRHPLNPNLYTIEVTHGQFTWTIHKRFKHFIELHEKLWAYRASLKLPIPSKKHKMKRKSQHGLSKVESKIPRFPKKPEIWVPYDEVDKRKNQLELYLNAMLESRLYRNHNATKKFLEVSRFSFIQDLGAKGKEGTIKKRSGGHKIKLYLCGKCCNISTDEIFVQWQPRWFVVKDTFIAYLDPNQEKIKAVLLFDSMINVVHDHPSSKLVITNSSRSLNVDCWTDRQAMEWKNCIDYCIENYSAGLNDHDIRFQSFAPTRPDSFAHWFVDGRSYFSMLADALEEAKEEIFITDWWLSPEIYLKRPMTQGDHWRLDMVLKRKAEQGVKIYVQLYKEVEVAVGLDSAYTKRTLVKLHPANIRVMRHPDLSPGETLLWAHHEKIVVIDQTIAFVGGIDLCYGRWDDHVHRLTDVGSIVPTDVTETDGAIDKSQPLTAAGSHSTTGLVFGMFGTMTMAVVNQVSQDKEEPRLTPLQSDTVGSKDGNKLRKLIARARKERKTEVDNEKSGKSEGDALATSTLTGYGSLNDTTPLFYSEQSGPSNSITNLSKIKLEDVVSAKQKSASKTGPRASNYLEQYKDMVNQVEAGQSKLWIGKDYNNFILKDLTNLDDPFEDEIDRNKVARMPWHDIACVTYGKPARDVARHFIQRWNFTKIQKAKKGEHISFLLPKSYNDEALNIPPEMIRPDAVQANVQILRSSCEWSAGICATERSIQNAYLYAIDKSEHFIYIENQFFITCRNNNQVRNSICEALFQRIIRAHHAKKNFRVYVIMPLLPGFEGDISDNSKSQAIRTVLYWQYKSINRGAGSLMEELNKAIGPVNTWKYISFCGLRTHSKLRGKPLTEMIYVHSKMLIVDDRLVIIGSANVNDRSMSGSRDSEVAMLIEDTQFVPGTLDGKTCDIGVYAGSLRRRCFCEHLGFLPDGYDGTMETFDPLTDKAGLKVGDVVTDHFFKEVWTKIAAVNTTVYEKVFKCVPSDYVRKLPQITEFQKDPLCERDADATERELTKICGYLVLLPLLFLMDEDLSPDVMTKEAIAPTDLWT